jgi:hypothetical protein
VEHEVKADPIPSGDAISMLDTHESDCAEGHYTGHHCHLGHCSFPLASFFEVLSPAPEPGKTRFHLRAHWGLDPVFSPLRPPA